MFNAPATLNFTHTPIPLFWTITLGPTTFSLDLATVVIALQNATFLNLSGTGTAHVTGLDDTPGVWNFSGQTFNSSTFSWSASTGVTPPTTVPEPATLLLVGSAIVGLGASVARRRRGVTS